MAAESAQIKVATDGSVLLADGTGTPVTLAVGYYNGDFQHDPIGEYLNEEVVISPNGRFRTLARGDRIIVGWTFTAFVGNMVGSSTSAPGTLLEFITRKGAYSANVSTLGANRNNTVDCRFTVEGTAHGDTADGQVTFEDCVVKAAFSSTKEGIMVNLAGRSLGSIVFVNSANTVTIGEIP